MTPAVRYAVHAVIFFVVIIVDQLTKHWALAHVPQVTLNRGISWGMLHSAGAGHFMGISFIITVVTLVLGYDVIQRLRAHEHAWPLLLVVAGSTSNIIDRVVHGGVVDFIEVSAGHWSWPIFNGADILIVCGVVLTVFDALRQS